MAHRIYLFLGVITMLGLASGEKTAWGYTVVNAPPAIESAFLANATNYFSADLIENPLFPNTYQLNIKGLNPSYVPTASVQQLLDTITTISTQTYVYGFADGMTYQQTIEEGSIGFRGNLCDSATSFMLNQSTTSTFDKNTCSDVINTILNDLFQMSLSTPTPIPAVN